MIEIVTEYLNDLDEAMTSVNIRTLRNVSRMAGLERNSTRANRVRFTSESSNQCAVQL